jgi:starch phosphorylase
LGADDKPLIIDVPMGHERLLAQVWQVNVGRNQLLLLDTEVEGNSDENRRLAARLYFGDQRVRIRQELLLGVGGIRALRACGIDWSGLHLNEGHSAFATLEYARLRRIETGGSFVDVAQDVAQSSTNTWNLCGSRWDCRTRNSWASDGCGPKIHANRCA